jgi:magnesium-protoporphyrin O-methyltransferase
MSCCQCQAAESIFSGLYVRLDVWRYRRKGPRQTTRMLIDALLAEGVTDATVLDIGGGVGAIQHALLKAGAVSATGVDAATAYIAEARREAERQGHAGRVRYHHGDFVELADQIEPADVVTLDRVICCYPDVDALVSLSAGKAQSLYGLVYPREEWWVRLGHRALNLTMKLTRNPFRVFLHPTERVDALLQQAGFTRRYYGRTLSWQVAVYRRDGAAQSAAVDE